MSFSAAPPSVTRIRVRYAETDQMGVVYHAHYFVWFEIGRVELLRQVGFSYRDMEGEDGCHLPVAEAVCRFKSPARYDEELALETGVLAIGRSLLKFGYRLVREAKQGDGQARQVLAEAQTVHLVVDRQMRRRPLPARYDAAIRAFMEGGNRT